MISYFVVQSFQRAKKGAIVPDQPLQVKSSEEAIARAKRLAGTKAGVVAFSRQGDETTGDYDDAVILASYGTLPAETEDEARVA